MRKIIFLISGIVLCLYSQNLQPPVNYGITSDYGPRNYGGYDWHWGIDYGSPMWTPVEAVEGGNIVLIILFEKQKFLKLNFNRRS